MSVGMDFLRRSARCSRLEKTINNVIRDKIIQISREKFETKPGFEPRIFGLGSNFYLEI